MRIRTTIILAALAALLGAFYTISRVTAPIVADMREAGRLVFGGDDFTHGRGGPQRRLRDLITRLRIERDGETIVFERSTSRDGEWRITSPIIAPAASGDVAMLCYELETIRRRGVIRPQAGRSIDAAEYGLDEPRALVSFTVEKPGEGPPREWTLILGDYEPAGEMVYSKRSDEEAVIVVRPNLLRGALRHVNEWRANTVVRANPDEARALEIWNRERNTRIRFERDGASWRIAEPVRDFAEVAAVNRMIEALDALRIHPDDFIDDRAEPAVYGLEEPRMSVAALVAGREERLLIGDTHSGGEKVYAMVEGSSFVFSLTADDLLDFDADIAALRRRDALRFNPADARHIILDLPFEKVEMAWRMGAWRVIEPVNEAAEDGLVRNLLNSLERLPISEWMDDPSDPARLGLDPAAAKIQIVTADGREHALMLGAPAQDGQRIYARRSDDGPVILIDRDVVRRLMPGHLGFINRTVLNFPRDKAASISIERPDGKFLFRRDGDSWLLVSHGDREMDDNEMARLVWDLAFIQALRFVERGTDRLARYGLDEPYIKVTATWLIDDEAGAREMSRSMLIGAREDDDSRYAMMSDRDMVFIISRFKVEPLERAFVVTEE